MSDAGCHAHARVDGFRESERVDSRAWACHTEPSLTVSAPAIGAAPAPLRITTLPSDQGVDWDDYVKRHHEATLFHTSAWRHAVKEAFGHHDHYLVAQRGDRIEGVLPLFLVPSRLTGRRLISVPCGVGGGILAAAEETVNALYGAAVSLAHRLRCPAIDFRSERAIVPELPTVEGYVGFCRALPDSVDEVLGWLPRKARAAARNARDKFRLKASFGDEHLAQVWRLYSINMRRLGSLNYPLRFFERLIAHTPGRHWTLLVRWKGRPVAGLITFLYKDRVMPYLFGATHEARSCSAANFIYLTVMERGVVEGYRAFDFGRSRRDNSGGYDFKRFNGFCPRPLGYQSWVAPGVREGILARADVGWVLTHRTTSYELRITKTVRFVRRIWPRLPLCVTRCVGARLTKHFPG